MRKLKNGVLLNGSTAAIAAAIPPQEQSTLNGLTASERNDLEAMPTREESMTRANITRTHAPAELLKRKLIEPFVFLTGNNKLAALSWRQTPHATALLAEAGEEA